MLMCNEPDVEISQCAAQSAAEISNVHRTRFAKFTLFAAMVKYFCFYVKVAYLSYGEYSFFNVTL